MSRTARSTVLTPEAFERLKRATETYREDLVVTLMGDAGLRPSEVACVRPEDLSTRDHGGDSHTLLTVGTGRESRDVYLRPAVAHDLRKFISVNDIGEDDPVFDVSARRIQMLVTDVASRTDDASLQAVSSRNLRQYFAHRLLNRERIHPQIVRAVGGWKSLESLDSYFEPPSEEAIIDAFTATTARQRQPDRRGAAPPSGRGETLLECMQTLGTELTAATTRTEVERATCEALAGVYHTAWVCDEQGIPRTYANHREEGDVDLHEVVDEAGGFDSFEQEEAAVVLRNVMTHVSGRLTGCALIVTPLKSSDRVHGLLCVAHQTVEAVDRECVADIGRRVGETITSLERKRLLLADTGVELTFRSTDTEDFLVATSHDLGCRFDLEGAVPVEDDDLLYFVTVRDADVRAVLDRISSASGVTEGRLIGDHSSGALLELVVRDQTFISALVDRGGTAQQLTVEDGVAEIAGVFSRRVDIRSVVETLTAEFPGSELVAKREIELPTQTTVGVRQVMEDNLTEKQRSVLRAAYFAGYFEWPRGSTAEELAASMGVSSPTLHNHLRKAQQKVLTAVIEDADTTVRDGAGNS
ncbi:bacterio-opsin activator domain-containing protein [Haladaptatus sp. DJG-WS-42]|uniref:bacterio-opsin activator domain-containing protein n=1 Tax=Haladaptatus sp. DJG-WS-42 TaxID=3120516 RepID=UPI0030CBFB79